VLVLLGTLSWAADSARAQDQAVAGIKWRYDYQQARREAFEKKQPILIDFVTKACKWCNEMDKTTFRDPYVVAVLNDRFIPLKIDGEVDEGLTKYLKIVSFPTLILAAYDGKVLVPLVGYQTAPDLYEQLQRVVTGQSEPEWMIRDQKLAQQWILSKEYTRAIASLKNIIEDGKTRPVQITARKTLQELEAVGQEKLAHAKELFDKGQSVEAIEAANDTIRTFAGLQVAREGGSLLSRFMQSPDMPGQQRAKRARELLTQANDFYKFKDYLPCLDRCEVLMTSYGDLAEGQEAFQLSTNIKNDPEWLQNACDVMSDRLGNLYLALADTWLRKGQPERARFYFERVIRAFPGTRYAESAQIRLGQLAGVPTRRVEIDSASNRP